MKASIIFDTNSFPLSVAMDLGTPNFAIEWHSIESSTTVHSIVVIGVVTRKPLPLSLLVTMYLYLWERGSGPNRSM